MRFLPAVYYVELSEVNDQPDVIVRSVDGVLIVLTIEVGEERVKTVRVMANPDKPAHLRSKLASVARIKEPGMLLAFCLLH